MSCSQCGSSCGCSCPSNCERVCAAINIKSSWNIPACQASAIVSVPGLKSILVGSYIWHPLYGYFLVQAINTFSGQVTIKNECIVGNAVAGSVVPACTTFMVSAPPVTSPGTSNVVSLYPFVAIDFVAPANGICVDISVTNVNGLYTGADIQIGTGTYRVGGVPDATTVNICNDGSGLTPGTVVSARTTQGLYQYPVTLIDSCCALLTPRVTALEDGLDEVIDWSSSAALTASGAMTIAAENIIYAFYGHIGTNKIWYALKASFTTGGVASWGVLHTVPFPLASAAGDGGLTAKVIDGGRPLAGSASTHLAEADNSHVEVMRYDAAVWSLGASRYLWSGGIYEI